MRLKLVIKVDYPSKKKLDICRFNEWVEFLSNEGISLGITAHKRGLCIHCRHNFGSLEQIQVHGMNRYYRYEG